MNLRRLFIVGLIALAVGRAPATVAAPQSMVAAAHSQAVEAGLEVLRRGGSALDAAIAVQMMLGVVEPHASGIGGGGFLLAHAPATPSSVALASRATAPPDGPRGPSPHR
ncbi:MAG: gamma-glutamyltransferase, partial [Reyranella sp.]|nr:gamma-glutamyltransferase [Reyranella sp.]